MTLIDDTIEKEQDNEDNQLYFVSVRNRPKYERENISNRFKYLHRKHLELLDNGNKYKSKSGAVSVLTTINDQQQRTILTRQQLLQCADAYTNSGIVRSAINRHIDYILGDRIKFGVELNEELTEFATDDEKDKLNKELESDEVKRLRTNIIRVNKRVELHDRLVKFLQNIFIFGRGGLQIIRFPTNNTNNDNDINNNSSDLTNVDTENERPITESEGIGWTGKYGEPQALIPLNVTKIVDVKVNSRTGAFEGFYYDYGIVKKNKVLIKAIDLIPGFLDDANLYDNTMFSGLSSLWSILNVVYANQVIDDEDIPESCKSLWAKQGFVYAGTAKQSTTNRIKNELEAGTFIVHNQKDLLAQVTDLGRDIRELTDVRRKNSEYILQCLGLPVFFMFEDSPNHATAIASLQAYKVGTLRRYKTWVKGILEKYWYDPMLADHFNMSIEDVISLRVKVVARYEDIVFDIFKDQVSALMSLHNAGVYDDEKVLKELGADDVWQRKREIEAIMQKQQLEDAKAIDEISDKEGIEQENSRVELLKQRQELNNNANGKFNNFGNKNNFRRR